MIANIGFELDFPLENLKAALVVSLLSVWVLVGLFYYLNRYTRRHYFTVWTGAWLFYAVWLTLNISFQGAAENPLLVMLRQWCLNATAVLLLWGSAEFLQRQNRQTLFGLFTCFLFVWSYVGAYFLEDPLQVQLPVFSVIGLASVLTGLCFYRFRTQSNYMGAGLLAMGFCLWGAHLIAYPFVQKSEQMISASFFISAVLQLFIAVSMIVLVLEEVRSDQERIQKQNVTVITEKNALQVKFTSTEERYRNLFQMANEGIIIADASTLAILEVNQAAERLLGLNTSEAIGQTVPSLVQIADPVSQPPQTGTPWFEWVVQQPQINLLRRDGRTISIAVTGSYVDWDGRRACQFFCYDLTARLHLEQHLRTVEKLSALGRMIAGVAHELNSPLAVIKGYAELMLATHDLNHKSRTDLERIAGESKSASRMVDKFLAFSSQHKLEQRATHLNKLVCQAAELCQLNPLAHGVEIKLELDELLPDASADADQLYQALSSVVTNALQAMAGQTGRHQLRMCTLQDEGQVAILVEDSGPGVPEALRAKIFEPFFTTKGVGGGTGLGLTIAHSIIADHQGSISCQKSSLGGAAFLLKVPVMQIETASVSPVILEPQVFLPAAEVPSEPAHILVVDDVESLAEMVGEILKVLGYLPTVCYSATRAMELLESQHFDLIFSDFRMPEVNGEQFYEMLKISHPEMTQQIVYITGDLVNEETRHFIESSGVPFLTKPLTLAALQQTAAHHLALQAA
jgi:PAS domain S-box-containing protein